VPSGGEIEYGLVKWILDGDTIVVDILGRIHTVHYLGIDAPEFIGLTEYRGPTAARLNEELTRNQLVRLVKDGIDKDSSGQLLRYVFIGDVFVNYELVRQGLANAVVGNPKIACEKTFLHAGELAKQETLGIWEATRTPHRTSKPTGYPTTQIPPSLPSPPTLTGAFTPTLTLTPSQTSTSTGSLTPTMTLTPILTYTSTVSLTPTLTPTATYTISPSPELTATNTVTTTGYIHIVGMVYEASLVQKVDQYDVISQSIHMSFIFSDDRKLADKSSCLIVNLVGSGVGTTMIVSLVDQRRISLDSTSA